MHPHRIPRSPRGRAFHYFVRGAVALAPLTFAAGCDNGEQKPKVAPWYSLIAVAQAQQSDQVVPPAAISGAMAPLDEAFLLFADSASLAQVEAARIVLKSTRKQDVRDYAQRIVRDHTQVHERLSRIARARGVKVPLTPSGRHADLVTKLSGVSAQERDEAFLLRFGLDTNKEAIALFERHVAEGKDQDLVRFARETVATLREDMLVARKLIHAAPAGG